MRLIESGSHTYTHLHIAVLYRAAPVEATGDPSTEQTCQSSAAALKNSSSHREGGLYLKAGKN